MWIYKGKEITQKQFPSDAWGFVYIMAAVIDGEKKFYIGKKTVNSKRKKKLTKSEMEARPSKRHKDWKHVITFTPFQNYYSSSDILKNARLEGIEIKRIILEISYSKAHLTFLETSYLFKADVLINDKFLNDNILGKFYKNRIFKEDE